MPLASILIPCFNAQAYVAAAIESALSQTYGNVEVIVVDDGSTDGSLAVIERYASLPAFRYETGPNRGGNAARNRLIALARGDFVQFLDADDMLHPGKVSACAATMSEGVDVAYCDYVEDTLGARRHVAIPPPGPDLVEHFIRHNVAILAPLHRTQSLRAVGGFDESLRCCQEYDLHLRLAYEGWTRVAHVPTPLCTVRKVPGSVSSNDSRVYDTLRDVMSHTYQMLNSRGQLTAARADAIATQLFTCSRHLARHGLDAHARSAYQLARIISPSTRGPYRPAMRSLVSLLGPVWAERLNMILAHSRRSLYG